jgi:hypothetical protein
VYPWVRGAADGPLDLSAALASDDVVALYGEHGGQVYGRLMPGLWEAHSAFVPRGRGAHAIETTRETLKWMFTRTDATEIVTRVPQGNAPARALAKIVGGTFQLTRNNGWPMGGKLVAADVFSLKLEDWMRDAPGLIEKGRWFHEKLEAELAKHGASDLAHPDDETHDRFVGAACGMFFGDQPLKAAIYYNRFAVMAGYHPIQLVSLDPVTVDIGTAMLVMREDDFTVHMKQAHH